MLYQSRVTSTLKPVIARLLTKRLKDSITMSRESIKDNVGIIKGYIEKVGDNTNVYDSCGGLIGYSNKTGTFTADGTRKYSSDCAAMLIPR